MISDGATDNAPLLQNMLNAACAAGGAVVVIPAHNPASDISSYVFREPVNLGCSNINLSAPGAFLDFNPNTSNIAGLVVLGADTTGPTLTSTLFSGSSGYAADFTTDYWALNLNDIGGGHQLNGLSAFTASAEVQLQSLGGGEDVLLQSSGQSPWTGSWSYGFQLAVNNNGTPVLNAILTTSSNTYYLNGTTTFTTGTPHNVELDYDGSTFYIFLDGHLEAHTSATGTVVQQVTEDMVIGNTMSFTWPEEGGPANGQQPGPLYIDGIHLSKIARHAYASGSFTNPTTKPTGDSNSLILVNFDSFAKGGGTSVACTSTPGSCTGAIFVVADRPTNNAYLIVRRTNEPNGTAEYNSQANNLIGDNLHDLKISGGVYFSYGQSCIFQNLNISFGEFVAYSNTYESQFSNITITDPPNGYGFFVNGQSDLSLFNNIGVSYPLVGLVMYGAGGSASNLFVTEGSQTLLGGVFIEDAPLVINSLGMDTETYNIVMQGGFAFVGNSSSVVVNGGEMTSTNGAPPLIMNGNPGKLTFVGPNLSTSGAAPPEYVEILGSGNSIPVLVNAQFGSSTVPVSNGDPYLVPSM